MFVIEERAVDGNPPVRHGSWGMVELLRGYNSKKPEAEHLRREHWYYVLRRDAKQGYKRRYKGVLLSRTPGKRQVVDFLYD